MTERIIYLEGVDPVRFLGVNNLRLGKMTKMFPGLRIVSRGEQIKVKGEEKELESFESQMSR